MPSQGGVMTFTVKVNGNPIPDTYPVYSVQIDQAINRVSSATVTLLDGVPAMETFSISASPTFVPGNEISIEAGYNRDNTLVFSGIITKQTIRASGAVGPMLDVECKDKSIKMVVGRQSGAWSNTKDSTVMTDLITRAGLSSEVDATSITLPELVQYYASNWDFMLARAEVNGMLVSTLNNKVTVFDPTRNTASVFTLTYGQNLFSLSAEMNAITQFEQVKASAWDYQNQALASATAENNLAGPGNISSKTLSEVIGLADFNLQTGADPAVDELTGWAKAQMLKSEMSKIIGNASTQGSALFIPGKYITLDGVGGRFDGDHFIASVRHRLAQGNWTCDIGFGMSPFWFVQQHEIEAPPAAGLLPGIGGLFNATVKKIDADPDAEYRIQVEVALFNDNNVGLWARLSNFYSTNGQGVFFLPEVGDEVVLGFMNQDPRYPVILGSLYSQKNKPYSGFTPNQKNSLKGIVSKSALRAMFDDENVILTLVTPANNTVVLDDKNKQISVSDENGNTITLSASGISIKSNKDITIEAGQAVTLKGATGVSIESSGGNVASKGVNITESAQMQYSAKGDMTAQVQGGTELTLKAAMVMIN